MAIITISRQPGSLGPEIAGVLKADLAFDFLDKESMDGILVGKYEISQENVDKFDERKPGLWESLSTEKDRYFHFMKTAIYEFSRKGNCIIVGRGGQVLFEDIPGVLRVRIVSPEDVRVERYKNKYQYDGKHAQKAVRQIDMDRTGFHKSFFGVNWEDPLLYDLIINTNLFSAEAAVRLIKEAVGASGIMNRISDTRKRLDDLCMSHEALTRIMYIDRIHVQFLEVFVENKIVTLKGLVNEKEQIAQCEEIILRISGVKDVVNEIVFSPITYDY